MNHAAKLALAALWTCACAASDPVSLPSPSGEYAIGRITRHWVDDGRPEELTSDAHDPRELTVHVWYPAAAKRPVSSAAYVHDLAALRPVLSERAVDAFALVRTHASQDAVPIASASQTLPVLVFSHGNDMLSAQYSTLIEEFVSHRYVVVAIDHAYDARAVLLASERAVGFLESAWPALPPPDPSGKPDPASAFSKFYRRRVEVRAEDVSFVIDRLQLGLDSPLDTTALDLAHIGFVGHSVGGVTAGQVCQRDARVAACLNLDGDSGLGPFYLDAQERAFAQPYMLITKRVAIPDAQLAKWNLTRERWLALMQEQNERFFGKILAPSFRVVVEGAVHQSFSDDPYVFSTLDADGHTAEHAARLATIRRYSLTFFDTYLKHEPAPGLSDGAHDPEATLERWRGAEAVTASDAM